MTLIEWLTGKAGQDSVLNPSKVETIDVKQVRTPSKGEILAHYCERDPFPFIQFDGFDVGVDGEDCVMRPDGDGHCIMSSTTFELMTGCCEVRVLIRPDTSAQMAAALLRKIANSIERGGFKSELDRFNGVNEEIPF